VGPAKRKELIYTGKMITAEEAERIGLVNGVISFDTEEDRRSLPAERSTVTTVFTQSSMSCQEEQQQQEKQRAYELAKILNKKLMDECLSLAKQITKNSLQLSRLVKC
jgi:3-hydroxypropionyl-coenzyme A dehydratase